MIDSKVFIDYLIEAGNAGVSVALMILFYRLAILFNKTMNNHFQHTEMAYRDLAKILDKHTEVLNEMAIVVRGCKNNKFNK